MKVSVCGTCITDTSLDTALREALAGIDVETVECMSGCTRPQTVAFREEGKVAYLFGDLSDADVPELCQFADLYAASSDGTFADARVLGTLRTKAIARIPG
ncbi:hypothetical protein Z946_1897 [Sulfitobacter noctilucicola]|uniref:Putative metal-binding protein n=1 Tax=Sulfitobacter noctilucicola TaxID=1342301 RepID=A0A7W6M4U2_9RHOB|nr:DUF1636 family protein [Sulfitobacter noctilucicola]KIN63034.1 hypothetical protein Z946_1897 [Sulfitobacter noctilucicola]MBB4172439.1 putative metal-binding protein [Sulfitobacter noctilucicola]